MEERRSASGLARKTIGGHFSGLEIELVQGGTGWVRRAVKILTAPGAGDLIGGEFAQVCPVQMQETEGQTQQLLTILFVGKEHGAVTPKGAHVCHQLPPKPAPLPPALIGGIVAKAQEQRQRDAKHRKGGGIGMGQEHDMSVHPDKQQGQKRHHDDPRQDLWQHRALGGKE